MALSRKAKTWLLILSIPVVLIVGAAVALKLYFTNERLKAIIVPKIEDATGRSVTINDMSLSIFPTLALEIEGLTISNRQGRGFSEKPFFALDKLVLDVRLAPLLKGSLEVTTVLFNRPRILLEVNAQGLANYSDEAEPAGRARKEDRDTVVISVESKAGGFLLSNFQIIDGSLEYIDHKGNSATRIDGLNQKLRIEVLPVVNEVKIESQSTIQKLSYGSVSTPLVSDLAITSNQTLRYRGDKDVLIIEEGQATVQDIALRIKGSVSGLQSTPMADIVIESDSANIADLLSLAPKEYMKKAEGLRGNGVAHVKITLTGALDDSTNPDVGGIITARGASIQYVQLPKPITNINIVMDFTRSKAKEEFRVQQFSAALGSNPLNGKMTVVNFNDPALTLSLDAALKLAEVKDYYPLEAGTELSGAVKAHVNIAGNVGNPQAMKASGTMDFQKVTIKTATTKNPVQNLNGSITFNNQIVEAKKLSMTLGRSDLSLAFWMKNYLSMMSDEKNAPKPLANVSLSSNHLYTADIMGEEPGPPGDAGKAATSGKKGAAVPLPNADMEVTTTIGTLTMEKFELNNVRGTMKISNGLVTMQNLSFNTFDGSIITKGTLNLQKPDRPLFDLAMDMNGVNANAMLSKFSSFGQRLFGKLTMNTTVQGALDDTLGLIPNTLAGQGRVQLENGRLTGLEVNRAIADVLKLPDLKEISFKDWANEYTIKDGRVHIKDLRIAAFNSEYFINGSQGLDGSLDFTMSLLLPENTSARMAIPGFAGQALGLFKDPSGKLKLDFRITGTSDNPRVELDTRAVQQKAEELAKQKLTEEGKKLEQELKKQGEDLLKGLFKKKK